MIIYEEAIVLFINYNYYNIFLTNYEIFELAKYKITLGSINIPHEN